MPIKPFLIDPLTGMFLASAANLPTSQAPTSSEGSFWVDAIGAVVPDWKLQLCANAQSLAELRAGWDGPGSLPISATTLSRAVFYVESALDSATNMAPPRLVPGGDGSVQIEWHLKRGELEFDIDGQGAMSIWIRDHLSGAEFDGEDENALALFYRWAPWVASRLRDAPHAVAATQMAQFAVAA